MLDVVYIVLRNGIDWSSGPPSFAGVGGTVEQALRSAIAQPKDVTAWLEESDVEIRAYFSVVAYDMTTTPPTRMDRPDLRRSGGPVRSDEATRMIELYSQGLSRAAIAKDMNLSEGYVRGKLEMLL